MPFSFQPYGLTAILVMIGILSIIELVKYLRSKKQAN